MLLSHVVEKEKTTTKYQTIRFISSYPICKTSYPLNIVDNLLLSFYIYGFLCKTLYKMCGLVSGLLQNINIGLPDAEISCFLIGVEE